MGRPLSDLAASKEDRRQHPPLAMRYPQMLADSLSASL